MSHLSKKSNLLLRDSLIVAVVSIVSMAVVLGLFWFFVIRPQHTPADQSDIPTPTPSVAPSPSPSPSPTPSPSPKPTPTPTPRPVAPKLSCDRFKSAAPSSVTIKLIPDSGQMTGNTVVRIKPGGSCPGTTQEEQWLSSGEREKTFSNVQPGTYVIEVANGNYQGVIRQTVTVEGNSRYLFTVHVRG